MYPIDWRLTQVFGGDKAMQEDISEQDTVSTIEFSPNGEFLAAGDYGGRVVLFKKHQSDQSKVDFKFWTEFASHEREFDCLRSMEVEEKINVVKFIHEPTDKLTMLLTTNDKTIKLWKTAQRIFPPFDDDEEEDDHMNYQDRITMFPELKQTYGSNHAYPIHSMCTMGDMETFLSADFLKINLWNFDYSETCHNLLEWNVEESKELITCVESRDKSDHQFMYGSSIGTIRLCDIRSTKKCSGADLTFYNETKYSNPQCQESFPSISSIKMTKDENTLVVRDYLSIRTFDLRKPAKPLNEVDIQKHLEQRFNELEANDVLYERFDLSMDETNQYCVTGAYDREFFIHDLKNNETLPLQSHRFQPKVINQPSVSTVPKSQIAERPIESKLFMKYAQRDHSLSSPIDYTAKVSLTRFHPTENLIATAVSNNLYIFNGYYTMNN